ncbi:unnamed protein product [Brassica oleracea]|uniref:(rape) hypothetical protein n=1 Tax=Brassica napus TaxID=3708 RepID=A0A816RLC6_BRANA|nr:unnamed protein product [Brassica napus]
MCMMSDEQEKFKWSSPTPQLCFGCTVCVNVSCLSVATNSMEEATKSVWNLTEILLKFINFSPLDFSFMEKSSQTSSCQGQERSFFHSSSFMVRALPPISLPQGGDTSLVSNPRPFSSTLSASQISVSLYTHSIVAPTVDPCRGVAVPAEQSPESANGLGLEAAAGRDDPMSGELEGLSYEFDLCEAVATWEQVRNSSTVLTKEYIDALPNGWEDYAWRRINKGIQRNRCQNKSLCVEKLSLVLPETLPYFPRQFGRCAVIGNSGDLLKTKFGKEIDTYDAVLRENGAPIQNYKEYVGEKSTFRLLNRGSAKALDKVVELDGSSNKQSCILNAWCFIGSAAKGTGLKALQFALSTCDSVDMYGFTVDPGYKEWTRYFSESRQGHTPFHGRAYYQMTECLGLIKIHSPMRADPNRVVKWVPSRNTIRSAIISAEKLLRIVGAGSADPLASCSIVKKRSKNERAMVSRLRKPVREHQKFSITMYPLEHSPGHTQLCITPADYRNCLYVNRFFSTH